MKNAIVFVNNKQTSIISTKQELIKEINHFKAFWLSSIGNEYTNTEKTVKIIVSDLTHDDRKWLSIRMR